MNTTLSRIIMVCLLSSVPWMSSANENYSFLSSRLKNYENFPPAPYNADLPSSLIYFQILKDNQTIHDHFIEVSTKQPRGIFSNIQEHHYQQQSIETGVNLAITLLEERKAGFFIKINFDKAIYKNPGQDQQPLMSIAKLDTNLVLPHAGNLKLPIDKDYALVLRYESPFTDQTKIDIHSFTNSFTDLYPDFTEKSIKTTVLIDNMLPLCAMEYETVSSRHYYNIMNEQNTPIIYKHRFGVAAVGLSLFQGIDEIVINPFSTVKGSLYPYVVAQYPIGSVTAELAAGSGIQSSYEEDGSGVMKNLPVTSCS